MFKISLILSKILTVDCKTLIITWFWLEAFYFSKKYEQAISDYTQAIKIDPNYETARENLENLNELLQDDYNEIENLTQKIKSTPNGAEAYKNRRKCYQELGKNDLTEKDFAKAKKLGYKEWIFKN